ncbi:cadherin domain-containing protein [Haloferula sp.]|uniref:cadherin domain-containing protein n=1 Tax=Haloferula sp. TaxID=2497595 RepID=UPI003C77193A
MTLVASPLQALTLVDEDFESGLPAWTYVDNHSGGNPNKYSLANGHNGSGGTSGNAGYVGPNISNNVGNGGVPGAWVQVPELVVSPAQPWGLELDLKFDSEGATNDDAAVYFGDLDGRNFFTLVFNETVNNSDLLYIEGNERAGVALNAFVDTAPVQGVWYRVSLDWNPTSKVLGLLIKRSSNNSTIASTSVTLDGGSAGTPDLLSFVGGLQFGFGTYNDNGSFDNIVLNGTVLSNEVTVGDDFLTLGVGNSVAFDPSLNDSAGLGSIDPSSVMITSSPASGSVIFDASRNMLVYEHTGSIAGGDSFTYEIAAEDGTAGSGTVQITISDALRLPNTTVNMPESPPAGGALKLVDALPGLTFNTAVAVTSVPGTPEALLIASIKGQIWYIPDTRVSSPRKVEILNVSSLSNFTNGRSIYSIQCFPDFATSRHIVVNYQGDKSRIPSSGVPNLMKDDEPFSTVTCDLRVSRFTLSAAHIADAVSNGMSNAENNAVLATEFSYLNIAEQATYHSINDAQFGPEGYLYVSFGDEGEQNEPFRNAQFITKDQYGSIIRIDVKKNPANLKPNPHYSIAANGGLNGAGKYEVYSNPATQDPNFYIPIDNPYVHTSLNGSWDGVFNGVDLVASGELGDVRSEMWANGLRNPFKFHLETNDSTGETEAWIGDVGRKEREEFTVLKKGENAGWSYYEGTYVSTLFSHGIPPTVHTPPLWEYPHTQGNTSAIGGFFYRSGSTAQFVGKYIGGDYGSGRVWTIERDANPSNPPIVTEYPELQGPGNAIVDFHQDPVTGDVLILYVGGSGKLMRITESGAPSAFPPTLAETGIFADPLTLEPNPGVVAYKPNLKFWSDGAEKSRWFVIKDLADRMVYSLDENWDFPEGMVWVKHFDFDLDRDNPGTNMKRLETRVLVRNEGGSYGVSYRWNEAGTSASLAALGGEDFEISYTEGGENKVLPWHIPSRAECLTCHSPVAGHALSTSTRQLNLEGTMAGQSGNMIDLLDLAGYITGYSGDSSSLPKYHRPSDTSVDIETRVRSYLAVNCAYCHQPGGSGPPSWDGRPELTMEKTGMLYGSLLSEATPDHSDHVVRVGDKASSAIWNRVNARAAIPGKETFNGYTQMPPLASNAFDDEGLALLSEWIDNFANVPPSPVAEQTDVSENASVGVLTSLDTATDPDVRDGVSDQSRLSYTILSGNEQGLFKLDPASGELSVNGILDYERQAQHVLLVRINDHFDPNPGVVDHSIVIDLIDEVSPDATDDGNGNGISDVWESGYGLVDPDGDDDSGDHDGNPLFFEFLSGGCPLVNESPSSLSLSIAPDPDPSKARIEWRVRNGLVLGEHYKLQKSTVLDGWSDMMTGDYEIVSVCEDGPGRSRIIIRVSMSNNGFLRLRSRSEP